ncbi:Twinfilin-1 [Aspergillus nanangensis]|uniref:Twinfilin n=1 Tax=Aspergillus nanangensis TaxID=2582783 RepID=A0AAD4CTY9_ASPNN|nr:Twinfilin-1 [Aspergillus nanangensis]
MQSGITVSDDLHDAFNTFATDDTLFCLPITITAESLTPLPAIRFASPKAFYPSLAQVSSALQPKTPLYLIFRQTDDTLVALTYIPSDAGVRAKTLFASTRSTLVRELGTEKFATTIFATEEDEVIGEQAWRDREAEKNGSAGAGGFRREDLMGEKERELEAVRRAEDEARSGTPGRDIGIGGSFHRGSGGAGTGAGMRFQMPIADEAKTALSEMQEGSLVQLAIDIPKETFTLAAAETGVDPNAVETHIAPSSPRYTFYHYPGSEVVIFIYTCPSGSSIKERMLYASSRMSALQAAEGQGLKITKKIEASGPDEITGDRLQEEVHPPQNNGLRQGFARPRRPGR